MLIVDYFVSPLSEFAWVGRTNIDGGTVLVPVSMSCDRRCWLDAVCSVFYIAHRLILVDFPWPFLGSLESLKSIIL